MTNYRTRRIMTSQPKPREKASDTDVEGAAKRPSTAPTSGAPNKIGRPPYSGQLPEKPKKHRRRWCQQRSQRQSHGNSNKNRHNHPRAESRDTPYNRKKSADESTAFSSTAPLTAAPPILGGKPLGVREACYHRGGNFCLPRQILIVDRASSPNVVGTPLLRGAIPAINRTKYC